MNNITEIIENVNVEIAETFDAIEKNGATNDEKVIECANYWKNVKTKVDDLKKVLLPIQNQIRNLEIVQNNAKKIAHYVMDINQIDKIVDIPNNTTVTKINCPVSCVIVDENAIPDNFFKMVKKFDKSGMNIAHKNGEKVDGAKFIDDKTSIKIK